jgi:DUF1009 family protein
MSTAPSFNIADRHPHRVGIVAGWGRYPVVVAEALRRQGIDVYCMGIKDHADPILQTLATEFDWMGMARLGRAVNFFQRYDVRHLVLAGKFHKFKLFQPWALLKHLPDFRTWRRFVHNFVLGTRDRKDDTLLMAVVDDFADAGITVVPATDFAPELLVQFRQLSRRGPNAAEQKDIVFGWQVAKELGRFDIGQSVVIKGEAAMAVEAIEGTDRCIERGGTLCRAGKFTVVKVAKPRQDMRFDVPTVGLGTLENMVRLGGRCLAVEAGRTILLDEPAVIEYANQHGVALVSLGPAGEFPALSATEG